VFVLGEDEGGAGYLGGAAVARGDVLEGGPAHSGNPSGRMTAWTLPPWRCAFPEQPGVDVLALHAGAGLVAVVR
jgi:hypothetical protein